MRARFLVTRGREASWSVKVQRGARERRARPRKAVPLPSSRMWEVGRLGRRGGRDGEGKWWVVRKCWAR